MNLKQKTVSNIKWIAFARYAQKGLSIITFIMLARLLEPQIFGLFAMAFIVIDGLTLFKNFGVDNALVQKKEKIEVATHTAFWMMPFMGLFIFTILYFIAPFASTMLKEPSLTPVIRTLGLVFVLGSIGNIPQALLMKDLRFKEIAIRDLIAWVFYAASAILLAHLGFGIWSLVYAYILRKFLAITLTWIISGYKPKFVFDKRVANELLHFGKFIFGTSLASFLLLNIDKFLIARLMGVSILGYYALAFNIASLTTAHLSGLINRVMFPTYAKIQDEKEDIKRVSLKIIKSLSIFSFPFGFVLLFLSREITGVVYGAKWLPMVPALRTLALCSMFLPIASISVPVFKACGKPKWNFGLGIIKIVLMLVSVPFLVSKYGLLGAAIGVAFAKLSVIPITCKLLNKLVGLKIEEILCSLKPAILSSVIMGVSIYLIKGILIFNFKSPINILTLGTVLIGAGTLFILSLYILDKNALREIKNLIMNT